MSSESLAETRRKNACPLEDLGSTFKDQMRRVAGVQRSHSAAKLKRIRTPAVASGRQPWSEGLDSQDGGWLRHRKENTMLRNTILACLLASSAMTLAVATPAAAYDKTDRAREAIAAAEAKIHAAETLGAATEAPRDTAAARAALASAREDFADGHKEPAIQEAIHAQALADTAIGVSQQHKDAALASAQEAQRAADDNARDQVTAAQGQAADAQDQAVAARQQAAAAEQQAADANARADAAQQAAAASAADAAHARDAAAIAAAQPPAPQVETTVTTQHRTTRHATHTKVIRHTAATGAGAASSDQVTTTTKVTPQ